jgi:hypothetical protein
MSLRTGWRSPRRWRRRSSPFALALRFAGQRRDPAGPASDAIIDTTIDPNRSAAEPRAILQMIRSRTPRK